MDTNTNRRDDHVNVFADGYNNLPMTGLHQHDTIASFAAGLIIVALGLIARKASRA